MADLIDRKAAILAVCERECQELKPCTGECPSIWALESLPSVEPEIVRCKDCKHYNQIGVCIEMNCAVCEDSFCCWAERRTDE